MVRKIYLINSPIIPIEQGKMCLVAVAKIKNVNIVKEFIKEQISSGVEIISAIGHESTAKLLSQLLEIDIPVQRISVKLSEGDLAIAFTVEQRLPEGKILTQEELKNIPHSFTAILPAKCIDFIG